MTNRSYRIVMGCLVVMVFVIGALFVKAHRSEIAAEDALAKYQSAQTQVAVAETQASAARRALLDQCLDGDQKSCDQLGTLLRQRDKSPVPTSPEEVPGPPGLPGPRGPQGPTGKPGSDGVNGKTGKAGVAGENGSDGVNGTNGVDGTDGMPGPTGSQGPQGPAGPPGKDGADGQDGKDGAQGPPGVIDVATSPSCSSFLPGMSISLDYNPNSQTVTLVCS